MNSLLNFCKETAVEVLLQNIDTGAPESPLHEFIELFLKRTEQSLLQTNFTENSTIYIQQWWDEIGKIVLYQSNNYGEIIHNPFLQPKEFLIDIVCEGVNNLFLLSTDSTERLITEGNIVLSTRNCLSIINTLKDVESFDFANR